MGLDESGRSKPADDLRSRKGSRGYLARPISFEAQSGVKEIWSGRRDSNPQPSAWEADALPLRHTRSESEKRLVKDPIRVNPRVSACIRGLDCPNVPVI